MYLNQTDYIWPFQTLDIGVLTTDKPVMVAQLASGGYMTTSGDDGDPFLALLPSANSFNSKYTLLACFPSFDQNRHFLQIIAPTIETSGVQLDGDSVPQNVGGWTSIPGTGFATLTTNLACSGSAKTFYLQHKKPQVSIGVLVYGFGQWNSYGYIGGSRLTESQHFCSPSPDDRPPDNVDNDCDGRVDEELYNAEDDDGDGRIDEDLAASIPTLTVPPDFSGVACGPGDPLVTGEPIVDVDHR